VAQRGLKPNVRRDLHRPTGPERLSRLDRWEPSGRERFGQRRELRVRLAAATLNPDLTQNLAAVYTDPQPNAYPLSTYSYLVTPCAPALATLEGTSCDGPGTTSPFPAAKGQELGQFVAFLACAGQERVFELGYSPLPVTLVQDDFDAIGRMNGAVQTPPPTNPNVQSG
jgi:phosphate transport system substrate-binding protein